MRARLITLPKTSAVLDTTTLDEDHTITDSSNAFDDEAIAMALAEEERRLSAASRVQRARGVRAKVAAHDDIEDSTIRYSSAQLAFAYESGIEELPCEGILDEGLSSSPPPPLSPPPAMRAVPLAPRLPPPRPASHRPASHRPASHRPALNATRPSPPPIPAAPPSCAPLTFDVEVTNESAPFDVEAARALFSNRPWSRFRPKSRAVAGIALACAAILVIVVRASSDDHVADASRAAPPPNVNVAQANAVAVAPEPETRAPLPSSRAPDVRPLAPRQSAGAKKSEGAHRATRPSSPRTREPDRPMPTVTSNQRAEPRAPSEEDDMAKRALDEAKRETDGALN